MKIKYPRADALAAAKVCVGLLKPVTERLVVAGSLRRGKADVGDVEILYIPRFETRPNPNDMFAGPVQCNLADEALYQALGGIITTRPNVNGSDVWGAQIKLARHAASGIPVDFFSTTVESWFNYLACRTGPAESNTRVAAAAQRKGWKWKPYSPGFLDEHGDVVPVASERDVFEFVGLPYHEPRQRR